MINRRRLYEKQPAAKDAQKIYILCEGDSTEKDYFSFFIEMSSNLQLIIIPPTKHQSDPQKLMESAQRYFLSEDKLYTLDARQKDLVWFVIDTDKWQEEGKIKTLRDFCNQENAKTEFPMFQIVQSNPCFEIWLYYHIYDTKPDHEDVCSYKTMKEFVDDKIAGGFNPLLHPIYIKEGITNSRNAYVEDIEKYPLDYSTQVFRLGEVIIKYIDEELKKKMRTIL